MESMANAFRNLEHIFILAIKNSKRGCAAISQRLLNQPLVSTQHN